MYLSASEKLWIFLKHLANINKNFTNQMENFGGYDTYILL